jgi:hypothetical protein
VQTSASSQGTCISILGENILGLVLTAFIECAQTEAVYGLTEMFREEVRAARLVANPGCYPTSVQLPLIPLLKVHSPLWSLNLCHSFTGLSQSIDNAGLLYYRGYWVNIIQPLLMIFFSGWTNREGQYYHQRQFWCQWGRYISCIFSLYLIHNSLTRERC